MAYNINLRSCRRPGRWRALASTTAAAAAAVAACSSPDLPEIAVADSVGISIVTNLGSPPVLGWTLDTVRVFGGDESGLATFYQVRPALVDVDFRGRIHLLEPGEYRVVVFDSTGEAVSSMGRQGEGPGELEWPLSELLSVMGEDTVALIPGKPGHMTTAHYPRCNFTSSIHQPLAPRIRWSHWGDRVAVSAWGGFRIDVLEGHRLVRSVRWAGVGERELSRAEAEALLQAQGYLGPCNDDVGETIDKHGFHPRPQVVSGLAVAPDGYMWAQVERADIGSRIMLLAPEGRIEGVLPDGFPMPLTFLPDGRPLIQVVDSLDFERVGIVEIGR